jgi:hypothetical protein
LAAPLSTKVFSTLPTHICTITAIAITAAPLIAKVYVSLFIPFLPIAATNFKDATCGFSSPPLNRSINRRLNVGTGKITAGIIGGSFNG